jgi:hypothetical protein
MGAPVKYTLPSGADLIVERKGGAGGYGMAGVGGGLPEAAEQTFEQALNSVQQLSESLLQALVDVSRAPEKVEVTFGVDLGLKAGVILTSGTIDSNFQIKLTWTKPEPSA